MAGPMHRHPRGMKPTVKNPGQLLKRLLAYIFRKYKWHSLVVLICIITGVLANVQGTMFTKSLIDEYITPFLLTDHPDFTPLAKAIGRVACFYAIGVIAVYLQNRIMVIITQGTLRDLRDDLFEHIDGMRTKAPKEPKKKDSE